MPKIPNLQRWAWLAEAFECKSCSVADIRKQEQGDGLPRGRICTHNPDNCPPWSKKLHRAVMRSIR